jgi:hypothetical protein
MMSYVKIQPDYFDKQYSIDSYYHVLKNLAATDLSNRYLCLSNQGVTTARKIYYIL